MKSIVYPFRALAHGAFFVLIGLTGLIQNSKAFAQLLTGYEPVPEAQAGEIPVAVETETAAPAPISAQDAQPVDLQADKMDYDETTKTVTASGNVILVQAGRILRADQITYSQAKDEVTASGYVVLNEPNGDIHTADKIILHDQMKEGFVSKLTSLLADGARFVADEGQRTAGTRVVMKDALYTPCPMCKDDPESDPAWQLKASEVTHDTQEHRIEYEDARLEVYGVPVMYTPYFSHPDGTVERKSGFLSPSAGYKSNLGLFAGSRYYWDIGLKA